MKKVIKLAVTGKVFALALLLGTVAICYGVGEIVGTVGTPQACFIRQIPASGGFPTRDEIRISIRISNNRPDRQRTDAYRISLFTPEHRDSPVASANGSSLAFGSWRTHRLNVTVTHNPAATYTITGFVHWGPDAQIPISVNISDANLHRTPCR